MGIRAERTKVYSRDFAGGLKIAGDGCSHHGRAVRRSSWNTQKRGFLECDNAVNAIGAEDAELAFVITAKVDETAATLTGAG
jgi:hypothetical protein